MDDDPRPLLASQLDRLTSADLPRLAAAWTPAFSETLHTVHLVLAEHERGDLSHVLGPVLDRVPRLAGVVTDDELLTGTARDEAEHALEVLEGIVVVVHAADLVPADRRAVLSEPWGRATGGAPAHN